MSNKLKGPSALALVSCTTLLLWLSRYLSVSKIAGVGIHLSFFSLFDAAMPLTGTVAFGFSSLIFSFRTLMRVIFFGFSPFVLLYHIPGLCAAASWASSNKLIHKGIPLICMGFFLAHPIGFEAAPYALYWFIPLVIASLNRKSIFLQSLSSTFIAHAVGSVVWIYTIQTTSVFWLSLIPAVALERLLLASAMTLIYWGCFFVGAYFKCSLFEGLQGLQRESNA